MLARVIRFYGGMPEDWLSAPFLHFAAMWNQLLKIEREEYAEMWTGMAIAFHAPKSLPQVEKGPEKPKQAGDPVPPPLPEGATARDRFFRSEAERLFQIVNRK
jgi:hypothetical protein